MRGGFVHNRVLIARLDAALRAVGATTRLEYPTAPSSPRGFVDIYATLGDLRIVCEAELRASRVEVAVSKATALQADYLLLVVPNQRVARAVRAQLGSLSVDPGAVSTLKCVLTLGQALQWVSNCFPFLTPRNPSSPVNKKGLRHAR